MGLRGLVISYLSHHLLSLEVALMRSLTTVTIAMFIRRLPKCCPDNGIPATCFWLTISRWYLFQNARKHPFGTQFESLKEWFSIFFHCVDSYCSQSLHPFSILRRNFCAVIWATYKTAYHFALWHKFLTTIQSNFETPVLSFTWLSGCWWVQRSTMECLSERFHVFLLYAFDGVIGQTIRGQATA